MAGENWMTGNLSLGINYWMNEKWGLTFQTDYKENYDAVVADLRMDEGGSMRWSAGVSVKFGGTDTDGDGIYDKHDKCPTIPGIAEFDGCPDTDGDGIQDSEDDCPLVAGPAEHNGCPDTDGDGLPDNKDRCPKVAGKMKLGGCPDADGDGIVDNKDSCPKQAGPRANRGCPWPDSDGDSVFDKDDECPDTPGTVANNGCPEGPSEEDMARITELSRGIQFAFGSATFTEATPPVLNDIVAIILKYPKSSFSVEGHTDSVGTKGFNQGLSERRANAVVNYLSSRNVSSSRLSASGLGETSPIDTNINSAGRANNRRVEIVFTK
jgi:outer membrane protein OmpA-like peptidoglycan-associated protein